MKQRVGKALASWGALCTDAAWWQQQTLFFTVHSARFAARSALPANIPDFKHFLEEANQPHLAEETSRKVFIQTYGGYWRFDGYLAFTGKGGQSVIGY